MLHYFWCCCIFTVVVYSALMFVDYLVVMTVLEEDFTDNNPVFNHSLFRRKPSIATRRLVPSKLC